jgi:hypothetical protein
VGSRGAGTRCGEQQKDSGNNAQAIHVQNGWRWSESVLLRPSMEYSNSV